MPLPVQGGASLAFGGVVEPMELGDNEAESQADPFHHQQNSSSLQQVYNPTLDLEQYAAAYKGFAKIQRLLHVADHCPPLRIDALSMVIQYIRAETFNVSSYQQAHQKLSQAAVDGGNPVPPSHGTVANGPDLTNEVNGAESGQNSSGSVSAFDQQWCDQTMKRGMLKLEKLDQDLKHYKSNSIKESIRRGQDDLGEHYLDMGDLTSALKCFSRARDYCTSNKHIISMCFNVIKVSVYLNNWSLVLSYVSRAENTADLSQPQATKESASGRLLALSKLKAAAGLAELANRKYKQAAKHFLQVNFDQLDYAEVISANNIAQYGALCALATFDRNDLQKLVISNPSFKQFLELEPWLNEVIRKFNESEYAACLWALAKERENLLLDLYLAPHLDNLYAMIRNRGLVQYFSPYLSADMQKMATAFNTSVGRLEDELMQLILEGQIKARIDSHNKIIFAKDVDQRSSAYEHALAVGNMLDQRAKALLLRAAVQKAKICVKHYSSRDGAGSSGGGSLSGVSMPGPSGAASASAEVSVTPSNSGQSSPQA